MDPVNSTVNLPGINSYVKRQVWSYLTSKYQNLDRTNLELIYNSVLLELTDSTDYEALYNSLQIDDEEQRLLIINKYLSTLVPKIVDRLATQKNAEAKSSIARNVAAGAADARPLKFQGKSLLEAFKSTTADLPSSDVSYSHTKSAFSQLLEDRYKLELKKLGNPSATDPDYQMKVNRALEETNLFQEKVITGIEKNPAYKIFDPKTGTFQDFKTSIVNQRISKLVTTGVVQPHGPKERTDLISSLLKGDTSFFEQLHISAAGLPSVGLVIPTLTKFSDTLKKTANGELEISLDPVAEFDSYTDEISRNSDSSQVQSEERNATSLRLSLDLSTQSIQIQPPEDVSLSDAVASLESLVGFSETLSQKKSRIQTSQISQELGISKGEFSLPEQLGEIPTPVEKNFFVTSDVFATALSYAVDQSPNASKLSAEDREILKNLQAQALGISGRMGLSFETQEELDNYLQSVRNLNSTEIYKRFKKYTVSEAMPELDARISVLQGKLSLQHSNIYQESLTKEARSEQISLSTIIGNKLFSHSLGLFPKLKQAKETLEFLRKLKKEGVIPTLGLKKVDLLIMASDSVGLKEVAELLEKYKKVKKYYHTFQRTRKTVTNFVKRNKERIRKVVQLLDPEKKGIGKLLSTRIALAASNSRYRLVSFLQNDVSRTIGKLINRDSFKNFVSKSRIVSGKIASGISLSLEKLTSKSAILFAKRIKDLEAYASSGKLFSGFASISASSLKKLSPFITDSFSKIAQRSKRLLSKINLKALQPLLSRASGLLNNLTKSAVSKAAQKAAYQLSRLLAQKLTLLAAKTAAKAAIGAATGGIGFVVISAVEYIGIKRIIYIVASIVVGIIFIILFFIFLIISTISASFNSSTSEATTERNIGYTYGTVSGSDLSLTIQAGSLDSNTCSLREQTGDWDNINKNDFKNIQITTSNCRIVCNMARAISTAQKGSNRCVGHLVNCNPNYFNGTLDKFGPSGVIDRPDCGSFNYYACNYLTFSAMDTFGSVVDPDFRANGTQLWSARKPFQYCVSRPFRHEDPSAWGGIDEDTLESNIRASCSYQPVKGGYKISTHSDPLDKYIAIPLRTQDSVKKALCVPKEYVSPGAILFWAYNSCAEYAEDGKTCIRVIPANCKYDKSGGSLGHTGLVLGLFGSGSGQVLRTAETNNGSKSYSYKVSDCTAKKFDASGNAQEVPGVILTENKGYLCRLYYWPHADPECPTSGSGVFNCPDMFPGTPGFMKD